MSRVDDLHAVGLHEAILAQEWADMAAISALDERLKPLAAGFEQIAKQHEIGARMYRGMAQGEIYQQTIQRMGDETAMRKAIKRETKESKETKEAKKVNVSKLGKVMTLLMVGLMVFLLGGSMVVAQDVTVEPSPLTPLPQGEGNLVTQEPPGDIVVVPVEDGPPVVVIREDDGFKPREWVWVAVIVVLGLLLGTQGRTLIQPAILELSKSVPAPMLEVLLAGARAGIDQAATIVELTPTTIDDTAYAELKAGYDRLEQQMREIKALAYRTEGAIRPPDNLT